MGALGPLHPVDNAPALGSGRAGAADGDAIFVGSDDGVDG